MFKNMMIALLLALILCTDIEAQPLTEPVTTKVNVMVVLRTLDYGKRIEYIKPISNTEYLITMYPETFPSYVGKYADKLVEAMPDTRTIFSINDFNLRELTVHINYKD